MKKTILLSTFSIQFQDWLPYPVGSLISYCKKDPFVDAQYEFLTPEFIAAECDGAKFRDKLAKADIIGFTCYIWNQEINDRISAEFKAMNPNGKVIYGGPQIPENDEDATEFVAERPYVDLFFVGPAEENFKEYLLNIDDPIDSHEGTIGPGFNNVSMDRKLYKIDWTPTPYTDGTLTEMFNLKGNNYVIPMETSRGCPFSCAFCDWGSVIKSKVTRFDKEEMFKVLELIFKGNISRIEYIDANFGIFENDLEYVKEMVRLKYAHERDDLKVTLCGFAKNSSKYLPDIITLMQTEFERGRYKTNKLGIQSHTPEALRVANRANISNKKMIELVAALDFDNAYVNSELIVGMPGESSETWLDCFQTDVDNKFYFSRVFPLSVMLNTEYYSKEFRTKYDAKMIKIHAPKDLLATKLRDYHEVRHDAANVKTTISRDDKYNWRTISMFKSCYSYDNADLEKMYMYTFWFSTLFNTGLAKKFMIASPKTIREQAYEFFDKLHLMPMLSKMVDEHRYAFKKNLCTDEDEVWLEDLISVQYIIKTHMRLREVVDIYDNLDAIVPELQLVYPDFNVDHIVRDLSLKRYYQLYSTDSSLEKMHDEIEKNNANSNIPLLAVNISSD